MQYATRAAETQYEAREGTSVQTTLEPWPPTFVYPFTHLSGDAADDYIIKCICGFREDDGNTVYCDLCGTWQHTECYYLDKHGNMPTKEELEAIDHFCADCQPRSLNAKGAVKRQRIRRKQFDQSIGKNNQIDKGSMAQPRGSAREKATSSPLKTPPNPTAPPDDELEDPAQASWCKFVGCKRAYKELGFQSHRNLLTHLRRVHRYSTSEASNESHSPSSSKFEGSGGFAGADAKKKGGKVGPHDRCHSCNRAETPQWRPGPDGPKSLCNDCGIGISPHHHPSC